MNLEQIKVYEVEDEPNYVMSGYIVSDHNVNYMAICPLKDGHKHEVTFMKVKKYKTCDLDKYNDSPHYYTDDGMWFTTVERSTLISILEKLNEK